MKKRVVLLLLALSMCMVTACGDKKDDTVKEESTDNVEDTDEQADETVVEGDISPDFKKEVDDYEKFFFEYVEAMKLMFAAQELNDIKEMKAIHEKYDELFDAYPNAMVDYMDIIDRELTEDEEEYWQAASKRITEKIREVVPEKDEDE